MPAPKPRQLTKTDTTAAVNDWMSALDDPRKPALERLRTIIRDTDRAIEEGVKWNCPSFRTSEYFATINLRTKDAPIAMILHLGAKKRETEAAITIDDPDASLRWLAGDRAMLCFENLADVRKRKAATQAIVRAWMHHVG